MAVVGEGRNPRVTKNPNFPNLRRFYHSLRKGSFSAPVLPEPPTPLLPFPFRLASLSMFRPSNPLSSLIPLDIQSTLCYIKPMSKLSPELSKIYCLFDMHPLFFSVSTNRQNKGRRKKRVERLFRAERAARDQRLDDYGCGPRNRWHKHCRYDPSSWNS